MNNKHIEAIYKKVPSAIAFIKGNEDNPKLNGVEKFYAIDGKELLVSIEVSGLPQTDTGFFGLHIHEVGDCAQPFDKTGNHYNPDNVNHPNHAGDMPPLFADKGYAWTTFLDERLNIEQIRGKSIVIHDMEDDFKTQPSGNAGMKIGCGIIV